MDEHLEKTISTKTKDSYQPHVEVTNKDRWFYWDGITYYGTCNVGETRAYFIWVEEELTGLGEWKRIEFPDREEGTFVCVSRERYGFMVQHVFALTPEQIKLIDRKREIVNSIPDVPRDEKGSVLSIEDYRARWKKIEDQQKAEGCDYTTLQDSIFRCKDRTRFLGYTFVDGLEHGEEYYWYSSREKLLKQPQAVQDFVNSVPLLKDESE